MGQQLEEVDQDLFLGRNNDILVYWGGRSHKEKKVEEGGEGENNPLTLLGKV